MALEQQHAQLVLQLPDLATQRRLRNVQQLGSAADIFRLCHRDKEMQLPQV
nr:hypothetical protein [Duganella sp. Leaf126]